MWTYNSARVHTGSYVGSGTNEDEEGIQSFYQVVDGEISLKEIDPIQVKGSNTEGTLFTLKSFMLYPKTDTAILVITNGRRKSTIKLVKSPMQRTTMFKQRL
jgi:hypothetical protein